MEPEHETDVRNRETAVGLLVVDTRGQLCPIPVLKASKAVKQLSLGSELEVWATDPGSKSDIPAWTKMTGNALVGVIEDDLVGGAQTSEPLKSGERGDHLRVYKFRIRRMR